MIGSEEEKLYVICSSWRSMFKKVYVYISLCFVFLFGPSSTLVLKAKQKMNGLYAQAVWWLVWEVMEVRIGYFKTNYLFSCLNAKWAGTSFILLYFHSNLLAHWGSLYHAIKVVTYSVSWIFLILLKQVYSPDVPRGFITGMETHPVIWRAHMIQLIRCCNGGGEQA